MVEGRITSWGPDGGAHKSMGHYYVKIPEHELHSVPPLLHVSIDDVYRRNVCLCVDVSVGSCVNCTRNGSHMLPMYRLGV